jgi:hypothetical protein
MLFRLGTEYQEFAGLHRTEGVEYHGRQGRENGKRVPWRTEEQNAHAASAEILLKSQTLIHCDERIVLRIGRSSRRRSSRSDHRGWWTVSTRCPGSRVPKARGRLPSSKIRTDY